MIILAIWLATSFVVGAIWAVMGSLLGEPTDDEAGLEGEVGEEAA